MFLFLLTLSQRAVNMIDFVPLDNDPTARLSFSSIGNERLGLPSTGGAYVLTSPHPVLLQLISVDRSTATSTQRFSDLAAEDTFYISMCKIGATWWPSLRAQAEAELAVHRG